jgi:hypothetical protein
MKKQIALQSFSVENTLKAFFGECYSYTSQSGNRFFESFGEIEVCMFSDGRLSLCGLGEHKKEFANAMEFRSFVKGNVK